MTDTKSATAQIDATLAALPADQRAAMEALRKTIAAAAPEAEETISYSRKWPRSTPAERCRVIRTGV
jgi:uncharacterized protein YdhG (YjbR/CyaY superfamily)